MSNISKFLINEPFLQVSVSLMLEIGQARAILLQKLHSLTLKDKCYVATYQDWHKIISFISDEHLKRILVWLEAKKLIIVKEVSGKRSKRYSIDFKSMTDQGFQIIESSIFHKNYLNRKMSFILPSLVNLVGITSAIFLQDFYYKNGESFSQMTQKDINKLVPYVGVRQLKILFNYLQNKSIIISEFKDESNYNEGKYYLVNKSKIDELLNSNGVKTPEIGLNHKRSPLVDNSLVVDNFSERNHKRSPLKPQKITPKTTKDHPHSIDQDQDKIFKENNTYTLGRNEGCDIIPEAKDDVVCLTERLMTHGFSAYSASQRINEFGLELLNRVIILAAEKEKISGESIGPGWITATAKNLKKGKHMNLQTIKSEDSIYKRLLEAETQIIRDRHALMMASVTSPEKAKPHLNNIRSILRISKTVPESNYEFAERLAAQKALP